MLRFLVYLIFIISIALTALGIILTSRLRIKYRSEIFSTLLYYEVFLSAFGFYGIWGQAFIKTFLAPFIPAQNMAKFSDIAILAGLPFLIFGWLMLIQFAFNLSGRKSNNWFTICFLFLNFSALFVVGYIVAKAGAAYPVSLTRFYFIIMNLVYSLFVSYIIHFPWKGRSIVHDYDRKKIAPAIFIIMIAQCTSLLFYHNQIWIAVIFILTFFTGTAFLPVYFSYITPLLAFSSVTAESFTFDGFCKKYDISARESDIVREICNGLSNKEISDKLFISLQTVKDHTHRIYIKTNVRSRVQLINLVKEVTFGTSSVSTAV